MEQTSFEGIWHVLDLFGANQCPCSCKDNNLKEKNLFKITEHDQEKLSLQSTRTCIPESRGP